LLLRHRMAALQILTGREPGSGLRLALRRLATQILGVCQRGKDLRKDRLRAVFSWLQ